MASEASGQPARPETFTVAAGVTTLTSNARQLRNPGGHAQVGLALRMRSFLSSRFRMDVGYHSMGHVASPFRAPGSPTVWIAMANIEKDMGQFHGMRPYLIAGAGTISLDEGGTRESHMNFAGGGGIVFPPIARVRVFVEARRHYVMTGGANRLVPISLGVAF